MDAQSLEKRSVELQSAAARAKSVSDLQQIIFSLAEVAQGLAVELGKCKPVAEIKILPPKPEVEMQPPMPWIKSSSQS